MKPIRILLLLALLSGPCLTARAQKVEPLTLEDSASWSMVLLPDPQSYVKYGYNQPLLEVMTRWIRYNVERLNIRLVLCTGDMVEENFRTVSGGPATSRRPSSGSPSRARSACSTTRFPTFCAPATTITATKAPRTGTAS